MNVQINYLAILISAVAAMVLGFLWYGPLLFEKPWMKLMGLTKESLQKAQKEMKKWYAVTFVLSLVTAYVLAHVMILSGYFYGYSPLSTGLTAAFWMWLGFIMPVQLMNEIFGGKKWKLFAINTGYQLAALVTMAVVLAVM